ncbi:MAG: hypothetical protein U0Q16_00170 [Bryobacteraceae bacterium]
MADTSGTIFLISRSFLVPKILARTLSMTIYAGEGRYYQSSSAFRRRTLSSRVRDFDFDVAARHGSIQGSDNSIQTKTRTNIRPLLITQHDSRDPASGEIQPVADVPAGAQEGIVPGSLGFQ